MDVIGANCRLFHSQIDTTVWTTALACELKALLMGGIAILHTPPRSATDLSFRVCQAGFGLGRAPLSLMPPTRARRFWSELTGWRDLRESLPWLGTRFLTWVGKVLC